MPKKIPASKVSEPAPSAYLDSAPTLEIGAGAFKDKCLQLLEDGRAGAVEILVTKHGAPVARVIAPVAQSLSAFGFLRGTISASDDIVSPDFESWESE